MKIGELAKMAGCPAVTIRYYEKIGLMPNDKRDGANHRIYDLEDGERLRFIMHCRNHKIPLHHVKELMDMRDGSGADGIKALKLLDDHILELERQRASLDKLIAGLQHIKNGIDADASDGLEVIAVLGSPCPHCPDYEDQLRKGRKIDELALWLAAPEKKRGRSASDG